MVGLLAGCCSVLIDVVSVYLTLGEWLLPQVEHLPLYLLLGVVAASVVAMLLGFGARIAARTAPAPLRSTELLAWTMLAIQLPAVFERVQQALAGRVGMVAALLVTVVVVAAIPLVAVGVAGGLERTRRFWSAWVFSLAIALGLAVNRNLVRLPFEPLALALDALLAFAALGLIFAARRLSVRALVAGLAIGALLAAVVVTALVRADRWPSESRQLDAPAERVEAASDAPHVLLLVIDTQRHDVFTQVLAETAEGARLQKALGPIVEFSQLVAAAPWTAPSMGSIHTGRYPEEHGFGLTRGLDIGRPIGALSPEVGTLAESFRAAGYATEGLVTNPLLHPASGISRGFDRFEVLQATTGKLPTLTPFVRAGWIEREIYAPAPRVRRLFERRLPEVTKSGLPLFAWVHFMDPHAPLHERPRAEPPPAPWAAGQEELYWNETRFVVAELAALLENTASFLPPEQTEIWIVSDHGEMMPSDEHRARTTGDREPETYGHGHAMYEELLRVPLLVRPRPGRAGAPEETVQDAMLLSHIDIFPTMAERYDLPIEPGQLSGRSFEVHLTRKRAGERQPPRPPVLSAANQTGPEMRVLRAPPWKLIHFPKRPSYDELYRLDQDPKERDNLRLRKKRRVREFRALLASLWESLREIEENTGAAYDQETLERLEALGYVDG